MSEPVVVNTLEELKKYLNDQGVLEVVIRNKNKKFKTFQKVLIDNLPETEQKELAQKVIQALNQNIKLNKRNLNLLSTITKLEKIGLILNGLNLCATCVGFAIMYAKLDAMSTEINQQLYQLQKTVKQTQDLQNEYEFTKVLAEHMDMLDCQRKQQPYSERRMRELVDQEYSVLMLLIKTFQQDITGDHSALIFSIFSMLSMLTASLLSFDEMYYFNNRETLGDTNTWHLAHDKWMSAFDTLSSEWFVEKLQDYASFETSLDTSGVDAYYINLLDQVRSLREEIQDNQTLITAMGDIDLFRQYKELTSKEIADTIKESFYDAGEGLDESVINAAYQKAMQQAAMA